MSPLRAVVVVLLGGLGFVVLVSALPRFRRTVLSRRLVPYLITLGPGRSTLFGTSPRSSGLGAVFDPVMRAWGDRLQHLFDDGQQLAERLSAAGTELDPSGFRSQQVMWGLGGFAGGLGFGVLLAAAGRTVSPVAVLGIALAFAAAGVAGRDRALTRTIAQRREHARLALPTVVDLVCLAVTAGESLRTALAMVAETGGGPLAQELRRALRQARGGTPLAEALEERARVLGVPAFGRFVAAIVAAQERGIPLADALRSLAFDLREREKRELIEVAGKKQISMLVPVVMLILPVAIVFAFYPGVVAIRTLAR